MKIELFYAPGCTKCADDKDALRATAIELVPGLVWRELNILDQLDYAVEVGVITLPSIVIDGDVVFASLPTCGQLRRELVRRINKRA
ncbi:thioredoxin family protein [Bradyrhizobium sp. ISRA443]|uniref:thioredoxin family protein n=1 Tax=unclassified Bradyrhizobium TaxID=2631580 RepID=UPI002478672A|nr:MULTISPECIES: thioredoxin family protein [unclassified Bradyrhizobium]WGR91987.1 thioredoxin family protein [Bradyrhizobium sp. ISRA435]WGS02403.1 thioredoxin family protein [Bradyrhizobium sp. ISRA436]WGS09288.1 thioredoxin family protein [Bradyrhizobium sp. ISRA437]WGS16177.1 thioredoxin family protein [Bradyrhizobium sp. ISRA443]